MALACERRYPQVIASLHPINSCWKWQPKIPLHSQATVAQTLYVDETGKTAVQSPYFLTCENSPLSLFATWARGDGCICRTHTFVCFCLHEKTDFKVFKDIISYQSVTCREQNSLTNITLSVLNNILHRDVRQTLRCGQLRVRFSCAHIAFRLYSQVRSNLRNPFA